MGLGGISSPPGHRLNAWRFTFAKWCLNMTLLSAKTS